MLQGIEAKDLQSTDDNPYEQSIEDFLNRARQRNGFI